MGKILLVLVILSAAFVNLVWTGNCEDYSITLKETNSCASNNVVQVINAKVHLTKSCILVINGCANIKKFGSAVVKYTAVKDSIFPISTSGEVDICKELNARSQKCPFATQKFCVKDAEVDISDHTTYLFLADGVWDVRVDVSHNTGRSCYDLVVNVDNHGFLFG